ncbi:MAG: ABC transporter ATP-binding protein [Verrucomicrobiota bacterium]
MSIHQRVFGYYKPFAPAISGALVLLVGSIAFNLLKPWPIKFVIDFLLQDQIKIPDWLPIDSFQGALVGAVVALVLIHLIWGILNLASNFWLIEIGLKALLKIRAECFEKLQVFGLQYHDHQNSSDLVYRVAYDTQSIQTFLNRGFATFVSSGLTLVGIFLVLWNMNHFLTLLSLVVVPFLVLAILFYAGRIRRYSTKVQEKESSVLKRVNEVLSNQRLVRVMNRRWFEQEQFERECQTSLSANRSLNKTNLASSLVIGLIMAFGTALLLYFGAQEVQRGYLTVGDLWIFISYLAMFYQPLEQLSYTAWAMEGAAAGAERVFTIMDYEGVIEDDEKLPDLPGPRGELVVQNVEFSYETSKPVLNGIHFVIDPGQTVAFVGGTGAGKTTLLSLIPRLYEPEQGEIRVDGNDISEYNRASLRSHISMVLQETLLVNGSIRDNLLYAKTDAGDEACWKALEAAQADEFVRDLENGLDSLVGEKGVRLSGGQRQRLGIARAFLKEAPILLMDEPTSSLDLRTEAELMDALAKVSQAPTTLIVTHRLNTIHHVDRIFVLEDGVIVEEGTGPELLDKKGVYADLWYAAQKQV